jgi:dihydroorotate dehydrogenase
MTGLFSLIGPVVRCLDPERAHGLAISALKTGLVPSSRIVTDSVLNIDLWGRNFPNPIGLAAGFDKNGEVPDAMLDQGFGFVEVGSVTPRPQPGNPKPRLFRLGTDKAVVNRMGFNNEGAEAVVTRLKDRPRTNGRWLGINLGKNKDTEHALDDYVIGIDKLARFADYIVVNVSSPNTPGLRTLQGREPLAELLSGVKKALAEQSLDSVPPVLLKVAPDLTEDDKSDIAGVVMDLQIDGIIATNTTIERPESLTHPSKSEGGGLSGRPLMEPSTKVLADFYQLTAGKVVLVGVGGVASGHDAYRKIRAGASLVQLYSALVYEGPGLVNQINRELAACLRKDGFGRLKEAVGADFH